ncbi:unnamed protein product [Polarella glacialis]|uniref:Uncharacterized protein n=1 Tax=Polarella glacialis TaxID=89957 RepID=A0A813IFE1_POLGL|nr:unnamed protein product [Polarella glacialis]
MALLRLGGFCYAMYTMNGEMLKEKYEAGVLRGFEAALVLYQDAKKVEFADGGVGLPEGGLSGGGGGATNAGGAGSSAVEEANSVAREAEKVRGEDETNKEKNESRNGLEKCCFTIRNTMNEEKLKDKFEVVDKEKDEFEIKQKEIGDVVYPILSNGYQAAGEVGLPEGGLSGGGGGATNAGGAGSSAVEEANSVAREAEKEKLKDKFEVFDKEKDEFEIKQKEIEGVVYPMLRKGYQADGGVGLLQGGLSGGGEGATSAGGAGSPTVEEANSVARETEKVRGEDETNKGKIESRNGLEKCCFTVRNTMNEEKLRDQFEAVDETALQETGLASLSATNCTSER